MNNDFFHAGKGNIGNPWGFQDYSIGIAFPPSWDEGSIMSLKPDDYRPLKPGMVFHVIPWLWGIDNEKTVGTSDTILITEKGVESFFTMDRDFSVNAGGGS